MSEKFNHKENCPFKNFQKSLIYYDHNGPDTQFTIDENGINWDENIHTNDKEDFYITFNFCPCCGVPKNNP
jgi:hypothetical protein